ncbi:MAG: CoB--CoM heterodisulfide reductase iron-sulfur subunit A family protein [Anaerolineae bacterium]
MTDCDPKTRALVIGAGIAGMQAALDIADAGYQVLLVDRLPSVGGRMAQLSETFPTLDCAQCILTPRTVEVGHHNHIQLLTYSEVEAVHLVDDGAGGSVDLEVDRLESSELAPATDPPVYQVRIRRHAAYVDWDTCTGCGLCQEKCPGRAPSEFERDMGDRKAIYTLSPQAVPNKPVIDREHCIYFQRGKCRACERLCPVGAIDFEQEDTVVEEQVGAIILAPGYAVYDLENMPEYGGGHVPDVIDALAFERLLSSSGPTVGQVRRPSDGTVPQEVVFVQCAGSRDPEKHLPYCSKFCCMYTAKQATLYSHRVHGGQAYVFYIDIRAAGKGYDEFTQRAMEDEHVVYLRGKVSRVFRQDGKVIVWGADTLSDRQVEIAADMVVVAPALQPRPGTQALAEMLGLPTDGHGWLLPLEVSTHPVETIRPGVFVAGASTGPMDIPETVAHASGAAAQVLKLFSRRARDEPL